VFSTKDRRPLIDDVWHGRLHEYRGGLIRTAEGIPEIIGGTADHVHLLVGLKATHALSSFVQDIKQTSSRCVHETIGVNDFVWQQGYGAFTVSVSNVDGSKITSPAKRSTIAQRHFKKNTWRFFKSIASNTMKNIFGDIARREFSDPSIALSFTRPAGPTEISQLQLGWYLWHELDFILKGRWNALFESVMLHFHRSSGTGYYLLSVFQPLCGWLISVVASRPQMAASCGDTARSDPSSILHLPSSR
jgi:REP element-mobilizing transposase RayT